MSKLKSWLFAAIAMFMLAATPASAQSSFDLGVGSLRVNGSHAAWAILISPTRAIVPAHAVGGAISTYSVLFGTKDRTVTTCSTCVLRSVTSAIRHPSYTGTSPYANDVAVITFSSVPYNANIQPVTLASGSDLAPAVGATVLGVASVSTASPLVHDSNHTVASVSSTGFVTTPSVPAETAGFMGYGTKIHGMVNTVNVTTRQHTFTKLAYYYTWILAQ